MTTELFYDYDGVAISDEEWHEDRLSRGGRPRHAGLTQVGDYIVSTVHLGLDHSSWMEGPPLIFETMAAGVDEWEDIQERYSTAEGAAEGHDRIVAELVERFGGEPETLSDWPRKEEKQ